MMSATVCLRCRWDKKRWGNGSYYSHGKARKMKTHQHKKERRAVKTALASGRWECLPRVKPLTCWHFI